MLMCICFTTVTITKIQYEITELFYQYERIMALICAYLTLKHIT